MSTNKNIIVRQRKTEKGNTTRVENKKTNGNKISPTMITKQKPTDKLNVKSSNDTDIIVKVAAKDNNLKSTDKYTRVWQRNARSTGTANYI